MFMTIAVAFPGIPLAPATVHVSVSPCVMWKLACPAFRVSSTRTGVIGVNALATPAVAPTDSVCDSASAIGAHSPAPAYHHRRCVTWSRFLSRPIVGLRRSVETPLRRILTECVIKVKSTLSQCRVAYQRYRSLAATPYTGSPMPKLSSVTTIVRHRILAVGATSAVVLIAGCGSPPASTTSPHLASNPPAEACPPPPAH